MPHSYRSYKDEPPGEIKSIDNAGEWPAGAKGRGGNNRWSVACAALDKLIIGGKHLRVHCANASDAARCATALNSHAKRRRNVENGWRVQTTVVKLEDGSAYCFARKIAKPVL